MDYKERISAFIDGRREEMTALLKKFVSVPSVPGEGTEEMPYGENTDRMLCLALSEAEKLGLCGYCYDHRADIIDLSEKEARLGILCHLDVVPATSDGWDSPPFEPTVKGNMLFGRGASDNKAPAVAALYALYAIKELGIPLKYSTRLYLGGCEENGSADLTYYLQKNKLPEFVFTPDGCFPIGNAERGRIVVSCDSEFSSENIISVTAGKSLNAIPDIAEARLCGDCAERMAEAAGKIEDVTFDIRTEGDTTVVTAHGVSTHAAHPESGVNALSALISVISKLDENIKRLSKKFPHGVFKGEGLGLCGGLDISLTQLRISEGRMFFTADGRVDLDACSGDLAAVIERNIQYPVTLRVKEPHYVPEDSEIVTRLGRVFEEYTGNKCVTYTLDAMTYAHEAENGVIFGGVLWGDGAGNAHGINECVNLDTMIQAAKIFAGAIIEFCTEKGELS